MEDAAAMLSDDLVLEILFHVKDVPPALFRCAMACKHWRGLVADLSFLRRCWPSFSFAGFITRGRLDEEGTNGLFPAPGSGLCRGFRALSSFVPALLAGAVPLVSRHGLLLVRLNSNPTVVQLAVCNLHVGTCHVLPPLSSRYLVTFEFEELEVNCYAVLSAADCRSEDDHDNKLPRSQSSLFFRVVIISFHKDDYTYHLHTLSSHETSWSLRIDCFGSLALDFPAVGSFSDVVVRCGTAKWFFGNWVDQSFYVAKLNTHTEHVSLTKLVPSPPLSSVPAEYYERRRPCLVLDDGEVLSLLRMKTGPLIEIWGQQDLGVASEWLCTRTIELKEPTEQNKKRELCLLGEKCGTLLITDNDNRVYTADQETGTMERVLDWPNGWRIKPGDVVPLEMDWGAVFVSRLGARL